MPRAPAELLDLLSRHHGLARAPVAAPAPRGRTDLTDADRLVEIGDEDVRARLEGRLAADPRDPTAALHAELRAFVGTDGEVAAAADLETARAAAVAAARHATGRATVVVAAGARPCAGADAPPPFGAFDRTADAIARAGDALACVILEPRGDAATLSDLAARARAVGAWVIADESRTAGRLAPATVCAEVGLGADAVVLGPSLAAGLPFGAVALRAGAGFAARPPAPDPVTAEVALAVCGRLRGAPVAAALAAAGAELARRCVTVFRDQDVHGELAGPAAFPHLRFAGQENAEAPLIAHHFGLELAALGAETAADVALPGDLGDADVAALGDAFAGAIARIRTLLIEHNSYLSGGIPFVFEGNDPRLRERGLARYRHPKLAEVDVDPVDGAHAMRIAFAAAPLGPITSSGFYLPTRLRGDFEIRVRYDVRTWEPGPDSACLGLFVQNEPSTARYYAQIMSTADRPGEVSAAAGTGGALLGRRPVPGRSGWLRLERRGDRVTMAHRDVDADDFVELAAIAPCSRDDVITGAKIWSKVRCGGLVVDLSELLVDATVPDDQIPRLEARPDPRGGREPAARRSAGHGR